MYACPAENIRLLPRARPGSLGPDHQNKPIISLFVKYRKFFLGLTPIILPENQILF